MAQIGTTKIQTASGVREVPVFEIADVSNPYYRVVTDAGVGAVPLVDPADATSPEYRMQTATGPLVLDETTASGLPASALYQWSPSTFTTGDSVWTDEKQSLDMSLTGDPQEATLSNGDAAVESDGSDDYGQAAIGLANYATSWAIELEIQTTQTSQARFGVQDSTGQSAYFILNETGSFDGGSGDLGMITYDGSGNVLRTDATSTGFNDGNRHVITFDWIDTTNSSTDIILDGSSIGTNGSGTEAQTDYSSFDKDFTFFAYNPDGSIQNYFNGKVGTIRIHDTGGVGNTI